MLGLRLRLGSAKVEVLLNTKNNRILSTVTIKYIGNIVIKNPSAESGLVPSPSLLQKHSLMGVTSSEVYISDVIGRRFEKVKNSHIFENWTSIRDWTAI